MGRHGLQYEGGYLVDVVCSVSMACTIGVAVWISVFV